MASLIPHKEERFILILIPPLCLLSGFFLSKLKIPFLWKEKNKFVFRAVLFFLIFLIITIPLFVKIYNEEISGTNYCFLEGLDFIKNLDEISLIYSDASPIVYAYTNKKTRYYPNPWNLEELERGENVYVLYTDYDKPLYLEENVLFREDISKNLELVFACDKDWGIAEIYHVGNL